MSERGKAIAVGFFVVIALALMAWLLLFLRPSVGDAGKTLRVRFSNIEKVSIGTRVTLAGRPIGEVVEINEVYDARSQPTDASGNIYYFELVMQIDSRVKIYNYDEIIFSTAGLLGEKSIAIIPRPAPPGSPPAHEITDEVLYARSTDQLTEALNQITHVAASFECTMERFVDFLEDTKPELCETLNTFNCAAEEARELFARANEVDMAGSLAHAAKEIKLAMTEANTLFGKVNETRLIERFNTTIEKAGTTLDQFEGVGKQISSGGGTLGRLLYNDSVYLQISGTLNRLDTTLSDINSYGLLFQYDKKWQRQHLARQARLQQLCSPCDFYQFLDQEMGSISTSLNFVSQAFEEAECRDVTLEDPCFAEQFRTLLQKVESLQENLKLYLQKLSQDYYQKCYCK